MRFRFEHEVWAGRESVFAFFENPKRLEWLHDGWSRTRVLRCEEQVRTGAETWVEVMLGGFVPVVMGFRHMLFESPVCFGEEAIHGPFSRFVHVHEFESREGGTVVRDLLEVCLPWYYGGERAVEKVVGPVLRGMFGHRAQALRRFVEEGRIACLGKTNVERPTLSVQLRTVEGEGK
jgi:ligand-binding SRPBCC domain-containing protein